MKISVGLLAYNSERWIGESATCLQPYVDEVLVMVDDATRDHTTNILDEVKIRWEKFKWVHDYSFAKNLLLEKTSGDWLIVLDDDERYTSEAAKKLIQVIKDVDPDPNILGMEVPMKLHYPFWTTDEEEYVKEFGFNPHLSILRKSSGLRYEGILHEGIPVPREKRILPDYFAARGIFIHNHAWKGNREKYEFAHAKYYEDMTNHKIPPEGVKYW